MSNFTWSYSGISLFKQCPQKFYRTRILKDIKEEAQDHLIYGKAVHTAAEEDVGDVDEVKKKYMIIIMLKCVYREAKFKSGLRLQFSCNFLNFVSPAS